MVVRDQRSGQVNLGNCVWLRKNGIKDRVMIQRGIFSPQDGIHQDSSNHWGQEKLSTNSTDQIANAAILTYVAVKKIGIKLS